MVLNDLFLHSLIIDWFLLLIALGLFAMISKSSSIPWSRKNFYLGSYPPVRSCMFAALDYDDGLAGVIRIAFDLAFD